MSASTSQSHFFSVLTQSIIIYYNLVFKTIRDVSINTIPSWCQPCHLLMAKGEAQTAVLHNPSISETSCKAMRSSSAINSVDSVDGHHSIENVDHALPF